MYSEPCAMLTMGVTPKMSDRPADRKKSDEAFARPFRAWSARTSSGSLLPRAQLPYFGIRGQDRGAVDVLDVDHGALAFLDGRLAHPGAHRALVIARAKSDRPGGRIHLQVGERADELLRVRAARLRNPGGDRLQRDVPDERSEARIVLVALLVRGYERLVLGRVDLVPRIAGDDPAHGRVLLQRIQVLGLARKQAHHRLTLEQSACRALAHEAREV